MTELNQSLILEYLKVRYPDRNNFEILSERWCAFMSSQAPDMWISYKCKLAYPRHLDFIYGNVYKSHVDDYIQKQRDSNLNSLLDI